MPMDVDNERSASLIANYPFVDVVVAGAGPAGSTCAYFLAKEAVESGKFQKMKVLLLEKDVFPRDKYCGDAWCAPALDILEEMGVLQELESEGLVNNTLSGGYVSPSGFSFVVAHNSEEPDLGMTTRCYAIKRKICDERIARKAASLSNVQLKDGCNVKSVRFDPIEENWTVIYENDAKSFGVRCKVLVASDGAASSIARSLNIVDTPPEAVACRRYVKAGTHNFKSDGVLLYPEYALPGYVALFRHFDDSIDLGAYFLPQGDVSAADVGRIYEEKIANDPFVISALGPAPEYLERLKVGSLRLGGVKKSYAKQILLVGDAAGQVDPLTGEGIHTGMIGGKIAAECILSMFQSNDFSEDAAKVYHTKWMKEFGNDFWISKAAASVVKRFPLFLDSVPIACASMSGQSGKQLFATVGAVMTGMYSKSTFLKPSIALPLGYSTASLIMRSIIFSNNRTYNEGLKRDSSGNIDSSVANSWEKECIISTNPWVCIKNEANVVDLSAEIFQYAASGISSKARVLVVYATEYGHSRALANRICEDLAASEDGFSARMINVKYCNLIQWEKEGTVLFVCSTAGDGEAPVDGVEFLQFLKECCSHQNKILADVKVAVVALGDTAYPHFCSFGKEVASLCKSVGADITKDSIICIDREDDTMCSSWVLNQFSAITLRPESEVDYLVDVISNQKSIFISSVCASMEHPCKVKIKQKKELTTRINNKDISEKETWSIKFDISEGVKLLEHQPGDAIGVFVKNKTSVVNEFLKSFHVSAAEIQQFSIKFGGLGVFEYLQNKADLRKPSALLEQLIENRWNFGLEPYKDETANFDVIDLLQFCTRKSQVQFQKTDLKAFVKSLSLMKPRYYSIASSPLVSPDEIEICVAAVRYDLITSHDILRKEGVGSSFLIDSLQAGDEIEVFIQQNPRFRICENVNQPKIMIGPGTGVAPFVSFIRQTSKTGSSHSWWSYIKSKIFGTGEAPQVLFFGSRGKADFIFEPELCSWATKSLKTLLTAFSREVDKRVYVQDRMMEDRCKRNLCKMLHNNAEIYICGNGSKMAEDVNRTLRYILKDSFSTEEISHIFDNKVHVDVWES